MNTKKISKIGFFASLGVALLILAMDYFRNSVFWINDVKEVLGILFYFSIALASIFLLLIFNRQEIFSTWKKFAIIYIVLLTIYVIAGVIDGGGGGIGVVGSPDLSMAPAILFFIVSILVIAIRFMTLPTKKSKGEQGD